jgi:hypothetical protein
MSIFTTITTRRLFATFWTAVSERNFSKCTETDVDRFYGKYKVVVLGALMIQVGAKMEAAQREYLTKALPTVSSFPDRQDNNL